MEESAVFAVGATSDDSNREFEEIKVVPVQSIPIQEIIFGLQRAFEFNKVGELCSKIRLEQFVESSIRYIDEVLRRCHDQFSCRRLLQLELAPFHYGKEFFSKDVERNEDYKLMIETVFLMILKRFLIPKYATLEEFLKKYPQLGDRDPHEISYLFQTANWFNVAFLSLNPRTNKTFLISLIPRLVEGSKARYITGSGQRRETCDRVLLYHTEGNHAKIDRPRRKKKRRMNWKKDGSEEGQDVTVCPSGIKFQRLHKPISGKYASHEDLMKYYQNSLVMPPQQGKQKQNYEKQTQSGSEEEKHKELNNMQIEIEDMSNTKSMLVESDSKLESEFQHEQSPQSHSINVNSNNSNSTNSMESSSTESNVDTSELTSNSGN